MFAFYSFLCNEHLIVAAGKIIAMAYTHTLQLRGRQQNFETVFECLLNNQKIEKLRWKRSSSLKMINEFEAIDQTDGILAQIQDQIALIII